MNTSRIRKLLLPFFLIFALGSTALYAANTNTTREPIDPGYEEEFAYLNLLIVDINLGEISRKCGKRWQWFWE